MFNVWDSEELFFSGDEYFDRIMADIGQAKSYITIEMYIFNDDILGKKIAAQLIAAQARGVKVQIIVDGVGSLGFFDKLHGVLVKKGLSIKMYNPLPFLHPYYGEMTFLKRINTFWVRILRVNKRDHRKIITIDQQIMYCGSFNVTSEHTRYHNDKAWKDMGVRVEGPYVRFVVLNFKRMWKLRDYYRYKKKLKGSVNLNWKISPFRLNQTIIMKRYIYHDLLKRLDKASDKVWLTTPYFIPRRKLIRSLGKAAERGVDVRILISEKTDVKFFKWLQYFYFSYLIKKGVKVYQYTDSVLHAKNFIIDEFITIGSTNLNHRSFLHDLEVDLAIQDEDNKKKLIENFLNIVNSQSAVTLERLKARPLWDIILSRIFFLFKYWF